MLCLPRLVVQAVVRLEGGAILGHLLAMALLEKATKGHRGVQSPSCRAAREGRDGSRGGGVVRYPWVRSRGGGVRENVNARECVLVAKLDLSGHP